MMSPEGRAALSARMKALNADPEFKAQQSARMKALNADPEFRAREAIRKSARMKAMHAARRCIYCGAGISARLERDGGAWSCVNQDACEDRILRAQASA